MFDYDGDGGSKKPIKKIATTAALLALGLYLTSDSASDLRLTIKEKATEILERKPSSKEKAKKEVAKKPEKPQVKNPVKRERKLRSNTRIAQSNPAPSAPAPAADGGVAKPAAAPAKPAVTRNSIKPTPSNTNLPSDNSPPTETAPSTDTGSSDGGNTFVDAPFVAGGDTPDTLTITSITSSTTAGLYGIGDTISITVKFSGAISTSDTLTLVLNSGASVTTSSTNGDDGEITFTYVIAEGESADFLAPTSLSGSVSAQSGAEVDKTVNTSNILSPADGTFNVDGIRPTISRIHGTDATYLAASNVDLTVTFSEEVTLTGTPKLQVDGGLDSWATYHAATADQTEYTFRYTVGTTDNSNDLAVLATDMADGVITDLAGNTMASFADPSGNSLVDNNDIIVDAADNDFNVVRVYSTVPDGRYGLGSVIPIVMEVDEDISSGVGAGSTITLSNGGTATFVSHTEHVINFEYTVGAGEDSGASELDVLSVAGGDLRDILGNPIDTTVVGVSGGTNLADNNEIYIDITPPTITSIAFTTPDGSYSDKSSPISMTVTFSEEVDVTGNPRIPLNAGSADYALYTGIGSGTDTLIFNYIPVDGDNTNDLDYTGTDLELNGGTIRDEALNDIAVLTLPGSLAAVHDIAIDTIEPIPALPSGLTFPASVDNDGNNVNLGWNAFTDLESGMADYRVVMYTDPICSQPTLNGLDMGLTGSSTPGDNGIIDGLSDGVFYWARVVGYDTAGNFAWSSCSIDFIEMDFAAPDQPAIASVDDTIPGSVEIGYTNGQNFDIVINFSEAVDVDNGGVPQILIDLDPVDTYAICNNNVTGVTQLTCNLVIPGGNNDQIDLDYVSITSFELNGATIVSTGTGQPLLSALPTPGTAGSLANLNNIEIDNTSDNVTGVEVFNLAGTTLLPDGQYNTTDQMSFLVQFDDTISISAGTVSLQTNTGASPLNCLVNASDATQLKCDYTVGAGDSSADLDYLGTISLVAAGGNVIDSAGNVATLTLPAIGGVGSVSDDQDIVIGAGCPLGYIAVPGRDDVYASNTFCVMQYEAKDDGSGNPISQADTTPWVNINRNDAKSECISLNALNGVTDRYGLLSNNEYMAIARNLETVVSNWPSGTIGTGCLKSGNNGTVTACSYDGGGAADFGGARADGGLAQMELDNGNIIWDLTGNVYEMVDWRIDNGAMYAFPPSFKRAYDASDTPPSSGSLSNLDVFSYSLPPEVMMPGNPNSGGGYYYGSADTEHLRRGGGYSLPGNLFDFIKDSGLGTPYASHGFRCVYRPKGMPPRISDVDSTSADVNYTAGQNIRITVLFDTNVTVDTAGGSPVLRLETGPTDNVALYNAGASTANTLAFDYTVQAGDYSRDLEVADIYPIELNGARIHETGDTAHQAYLLVPHPGEVSSLSSNRDISINSNCPVGYVQIAANDAVGTRNDFCIAKYEMRNVAGTATSQAAGVPWVGIPGGISDAKTECTDLGPNYDLVSNPEWLATAYEIEAEFKNWQSGVVGSGTLYRGHSDNTPNNVVGITDENDGYTDIGATDDDQRRYHYTALGEQIWDLSGNATEWVDLDLGGGIQTYPTTCLGSSQFNSLSCPWLDQISYMPGNPGAVAPASYDNTYGIGRYFGGSGASDTSFIRGAAYYNTTNAGVFSLEQEDPAHASVALAFRCVYRPNGDPPIVTNVTAVQANGVYTTGQTVRILITFDQNVTVTNNPRLLMETGTTDTEAIYNAAAPENTANTIAFDYTIVASDSSNDLDYEGIDAINLNGGDIYATSDINLKAHLLLPIPGETGSLANNKNLLINQICPDNNWLTVSPNPDVGTNQSFCVAKYEMRDDGGGNPVSQPAGLPWVSINQIDADLECRSLGAGYKLINNEEWVTIAREIEGVAANFNTPVDIANRDFSQGHGFNDPPNLIAADVTGDPDDDPCVNVGSVVGACDTANWNERRRTMQLASGQWIWDFGGNAGEVIDDHMGQYTAQQEGTWYSGVAAINPIYAEMLEFYGPIQTPVSSLNILGSLYGSYFDYLEPTVSPRRGGRFSDTGASSAYKLSYWWNETSANPITGFRCVYYASGLPATVTSVTTAKADGAYTTGEQVDIAVQFSNTISVDTAGGTPTLEIKLDGVNRQASYIGVSPANTVNFRYTVQAGDESDDLGYVHRFALQLNGGRIIDSSSVGANVRLPDPYMPGSIRSAKSIKIKTAGPTVNEVYATNIDGVYNTGDTIITRVEFNDELTVTGTPQLLLEMGATDRQANFTNWTFDSTNIIGHWQFDERLPWYLSAPSADFFQDSSGNNNHGTFNIPGYAYYQEGKFGSSFDFDGSDDYIELTDNANYNFDPAQDYTWSVWIKPDSFGIGRPVWSQDLNADNHIIMWAYDRAAPNDGWETCTQCLAFGIETGGTNRIKTASFDNSLQSGVWQHVVVTYTAAADLANRIKIYIDGKLSTDSTKTVAAGTLGTINPSRTTIAGIPPGGFHFDGQIDELAFWNTSKTSNQIAKMYTGDSYDTLAFEYTIQEGDLNSDLDYVATNSLTLNGGTITNDVNNAVLTLPIPTAVNSISDDQQIQINGNCPVGYVLVSANSNLGIRNDFCVAKYEMKDVAGTATSQPAGQPWNNITFPNAKAECTALGANYDLMSNSEQMTIAYELENNPANWSSGVVGTGMLNIGHSDNVPASRVGTLDPSYSWDSTGNTTWAQKRTFALSDGQVLWDFAGNVNEFLDWRLGGTWEKGPTSCALRTI
jgi:hypothetical protein